MSRVMFPFSQVELDRQESQPKKQWRWQGFFKERDPQKYAQEWRAMIDSLIVATQPQNRL